MAKDQDLELFKDGKRIDGRGPEEFRPISMDVGVLKRADGSATVELGDTRALSAVFGPKELHPKHRQNPEKAVLDARYNMAPFAVEDRKRPGPSRRSKEIGLVGKRSLEPVVRLEKFPNTVIDVQIEILEANASTRVTGLTAASLALANAGIPMKGMVSACAVGKLEDIMVLDVAGKEDASGKADIPVAMMTPGEKITLLQFDGDIARQDLERGLELAKKGCRILHEKQKETLKQKYGTGE